jgi:hypothetical protein
MKILIGIVLVLAAGCGAALKRKTQAVTPPPPCDLDNCTNGARAHGTADDRAPRVEAITPR